MNQGKECPGCAAVEQSVDTIFVMLGRGCNLQCKYCLQHDVVNDHLSAEVSPDVVDFIVNHGAASNFPVRVQFYGGEPLVYWPVITSMVSELKARKANVIFSTITNGKLLDDEKVKFINENFSSISISWDGRNVLRTRGYDVFVDRRDQLFALKNVCVSGVLSAYNSPLDFMTDFEALNAEYYEVNGRPMMMNIDELLDVNLQNEDLKNFDFAKLQQQVFDVCREYLLYATAGTQLSVPRLNWVQSKVNNLKAGLNVGRPQKARCNNGYGVVNVDLAGNIYRCHNTGDVVGRVVDDPVVVHEAVVKADPTQRHNERCSRCPVQFMCQNGCPIVGDEARADFYCRQVNAINAPIVDMVLKFNDILR